VSFSISPPLHTRSLARSLTQPMYRSVHTFYLPTYLSTYDTSRMYPYTNPLTHQRILYQSGPPAELQAQMGIGDVGAGYLYSVYSLPNIVMVFGGGILVDRVGTRRASLLFSSLVTAGALVVAVGVAAFSDDPSQYCVEVEVSPPPKLAAAVMPAISAEMSSSSSIGPSLRGESERELACVCQRLPSCSIYL
jgi:MFS family permease